MINKVTLLGHLGSDPEIRTTESDKKVVNLSLATTERWTDDTGTKKESTQWHNIVFWGKQAEIVAQYTKKGDRFYCEGRIEYRDYTDKEGLKRKVTDIIGSEFRLIQNKPSQG